MLNINNQQHYGVREFVHFFALFTLLFLLVLLN